MLPIEDNEGTLQNITANKDLEMLPIKTTIT